METCPICDAPILAPHQMSMDVETGAVHPCYLAWVVESEDGPGGAMRLYSLALATVGETRPIDETVMESFTGELESVEGVPSSWS